MSEDNKLVPKSTNAEKALDIASFVGSAVPWIGGPISNVLGGMSLGRKLDRVKEVLESVASDLSDFKSDASENYVKTDEFEDLLEQTLKRVGEERNEEKRRLYKSFLTDTIASPGASYDDQLKMLRTFEQLTIDHIQMLKALKQEPGETNSYMGSPIKTLRQRLPDFNDENIEELIDQLNDLRITNMTSLKVMMTAQGATDLRHVTTDFGNKIINYIYKA